MLRYVLMYVAVIAYIYGGMWATSKFEPRKHPWGLWRGQYRALFPGDLGLGLALVAGVALMWSTNDTTPWWWKLVSLILGLALGIVLFLFQISPEEKVDGRMFAPTRIWHQLFIWGLISAGALAYELPAIGLAVWHWRMSYLEPLLLMALGLAIWIGCSRWDVARAKAGTLLDPEHPIHVAREPRAR